jgi:hypothetical protein
MLEIVAIARAGHERVAGRGVVITSQPGEKVSFVIGEGAHAPGGNIENVRGVVGRIRSAAPEAPAAIGHGDADTAWPCVTRERVGKGDSAETAADDEDVGHHGNSDWSVIALQSECQAPGYARASGRS